MKKILVILLLICPVVISAQIPDISKALVSPNAANLGLYGEIPVSLYTGTPNINIPIYTIDNTDFSISLSYHASGVRPDQQSGWIGTGWSLNAGGVISRTVKDVPDDYFSTCSISNRPERCFCKGYWHTYQEANLQAANWNQSAFVDALAKSNYAHYADTEPDEFSFHFGNYNGSFYFNSNGQWVVKCDKPVKVKLDGNPLNVPFTLYGDNRPSMYGHTPTFRGFTITTEDGAQYIFGGDASSLEYSVGFYEQTINEWTATSWYLTKIIYPDNTEINLTYERKEFINQMAISVYEILNYQGKTGSGSFLDVNCSSFSTKSLSYFYNGMLISPVYLSSIKTKNCNIYFNISSTSGPEYDQDIYTTKYNELSPPSNRNNLLPYLNPNTPNNADEFPACLKNMKWYILDDIVIKDHADVIMTDWVFSRVNINGRLFLVLLRESGGLEGRKNYYSFEYTNKESLPKFLANKTDHWGFFNNTFADISNVANYYSKREPNSGVFLYGSLSKITYATGGYTRFVFEPHQYRKQLNNKQRWVLDPTLSANKSAGGLRIKQIYNSATGNASDEQLVHEYYYVSDYLANKQNASMSSGVLGGQSQYYFPDYDLKSYNSNNTTYRKIAFSSQSVLPMSNNSQGSHIGYTEVIERRGDGSFSRYQFTNFDNGHLDESADYIIQLTRTPYEPYNSKEQERGMLILQQDFNSSGQKIKSKGFTYEKDDSGNNNFVRSVRADYGYICHPNDIKYIEGSAYRLYTYTYRIQSETDTLFYPEQGSSFFVDTKKSYTYNSYKLPQTTTEIIKRGTQDNTYVTTYRYPTDISTTAYQNMVNANRIAYPVETLTKLNDKIIKGSLLTYENLFPKSQYELQLNEPLASSSFTLYNGTQMDSRYGSPALTVVKYTDSGSKKILELRGRDDVSTTYLWGYEGQYPIAEIKGATYDQVKGKISESSLQTISNKAKPTASDLKTINGLRGSLSGAMVTTFTYHPPKGILSITNPRGISTYYNYDDFGRLRWIYDYEYNKLNNYVYNTKDYLLNSRPPLTVSLVNVNSEYHGSFTLNCSVSVSGGAGPGKRTHLWTLNDNMIGTDSSSLSYYLSAGIYTLSCLVNDLVTGEAVKVSKNIVVYSN